MTSSGERAEAGEKCAADHVRDPQRHHGLRQQGGDKEDGADQREHVGERDVGEKDFQKAIEDRVVGDVVGIETELNQDLGDPQIVGRRVENAVQDRRHVCTEYHWIPRAKLPVIAGYPGLGENQGRAAIKGSY